jgi:hypothetical protein
MSPATSDRLVYVKAARTLVPEEAVAVVTALSERLSRIIAECRNNISGAEEDRSRDTLLTEIIRIAEGVPTPAPLAREGER